MNTIAKPSSNFDSRDGHAVDMLVLHYTGMKTATEALDRLCDPAAKVSAHYMVDEDGTVYNVVAEENRAWHAGVSSWRGAININQRSIGIEIVNPGHEFGYRDFPPAQIEAVIALCQDILKRNKNISARNVVAHSDIAPERKDDPGEKFPWEQLTKEGIGLWPKGLGIRDLGLDSSLMPNAQSIIPLQTYGYDIANPSAAITAFQRHFRPKLLNGKWDNECAALLAALLSMI